MAFLRTSFAALKASKRENFESTYKFRKKVSNFKEGSDVYVIPLGLEQGFFETPTHKVNTHEVDGQTIGFGGGGFPATIKCKGYDEFGNKVESLCCKLARLEKERFPERDDSGKRVIGFSSNRIHVPILILGNSLTDKSKIAYPITKVSILNELNSPQGLNFSYLEMASSTFENDIFKKLGEELKNQGIIEYEMDENSEDFFNIVQQHLSNCIIKVKGITKQGFQVALQQYSFFPFASQAIATTVASQSPAGEREAILGYKNNDTIMEKVNEYLQLFRSEVDNIFRDWTDKDLQEYYNSAIGTNLKADIPQVSQPQEVVTVIQPTVQPTPQAVAPTAPVAQQVVQTQVTPAQPVAQAATTTPTQATPVVPVATDTEIDNLIADPFNGADPVEATSDEELDNFEFNMDDEDFLS